MRINACSMINSYTSFHDHDQVKILARRPSRVFVRVIASLNEAQIGVQSWVPIEAIVPSARLIDRYTFPDGTQCFRDATEKLIRF